MRSKTKWLLLVGLAASSLALVHCVGDEPAGGGDSDAGGGGDSGTPDTFVPPGDSGGSTDSGVDAGPGLCANPAVTCAADANPCIVQVAGSGPTFCARDNNCNLYCWGGNGDGQLAKDPSSTPFSATPLKIDLGGLLAFGVDVGVDADLTFRGEAVVCARVASTPGSSVSVMCWGANRWGQLGIADAGPEIDDGGYPISTKPLLVPGLTGIALMNAGSRHECAMTGGGVVDCWGDNFYGELGRTTANNFDPTPNPVTGITVAAEAEGVVGVGYVDTCVINGGGRVSCVGANGQKQLGSDAGDGDKTNAAFAQVAGTNNSVSIVTNSKSTCAITTTNTLLCWGQNDHQEMGNATGPVDQITPTSPSGLGATGAGGAQAGAQQFCANLGTLPTTDGGVTPNVECWGGNGFGQSITPTDGGDIATPTLVTGLPRGKAVRLAAGGESSCALINDGTVWCWGTNALGELGNRGVGGNDGTILPPGKVAF